MSSWYASIPSPGPEWQNIPIDLFGWHWRIQTYAIMILIGIVVAVLWTSRRLSKRGGEPGVVLSGLPVEEDRAEFLAEIRDAAAEAAAEGGRDEARLRETVRLAVRRAATRWTGKKPVVEVSLLQV